MMAALSFITGPIGKWLLVGLAVAALVAGVYAKGRADRAHADAPRITDAATGKTWEAEAQLAAASLTNCHASVQNLSAGLAAQNAAAEAAKASGDRMEAEIAQARQAARKSAAVAQSAADRLAAFKPAGADACARLLSVDAQVKEISQ